MIGENIGMGMNSTAPLNNYNSFDTFLVQGTKPRVRNSSQQPAQQQVQKPMPVDTNPTEYDGDKFEKQENHAKLKRVGKVALGVAILGGVLTFALNKNKPKAIKDSGLKFDGWDFLDIFTWGIIFDWF